VSSGPLSRNIKSIGWGSPSTSCSRHRRSMLYRARYSMFICRSCRYFPASARWATLCRAACGLPASRSTWLERGWTRDRSSAKRSRQSQRATPTRRSAAGFSNVPFPLPSKWYVPSKAENSRWMRNANRGGPHGSAGTKAVSSPRSIRIWSTLRRRSVGDASEARRVQMLCIGSERTLCWSLAPTFHVTAGSDREDAA